MLQILEYEKDFFQQAYCFCPEVGQSVFDLNEVCHRSVFF